LANAPEFPFRKWPHTQNFKDLRLSGPVNYVGRVKLHGANAAIRCTAPGEFAFQSRNRDVTFQSDNAGFAAWAMAAVAANPPNMQPGDVLYGEWVGPGIMKGCAVHSIPGRVFVMFGFWDASTQKFRTQGYDLRYFAGALYRNREDVSWLDAAHRVTLDPQDRKGFAAATAEIQRKVLEVEDCDPWVRDNFGVRGIGEGLVYMPDVELLAEADWGLVFKAKGERHKGSEASGAPKAPRVTGVPANVADIVERFVTPERCAQWAFDVNGGEGYAREKTGDFIKAMCADIAREGAQEMAEQGLAWKQIGGAVGKACADWYKGVCG